MRSKQHFKQERKLSQSDQKLNSLQKSDQPAGIFDHSLHEKFGPGALYDFKSISESG